jgi:2-dehydropantoate 2-reductase
VRCVLVVGAGALGTLYGEALARGGAEVQLLARPAHAAAVARAGRERLSAVSDPAGVAPADTVIVMTKSHATAAALAPLSPEGVEVAVSFQNGVEKDRLLADWCGEERVLGGSSMVGATLVEPGVVKHTLEGTTYVGELGGGVSERARALGAAIEAGGLPVVVTERVLSVEWSKLVHAAATVAIAALPRLPFHRALLDPGLAHVYVETLREGAAVAAAAGVELGDWPGMFPVATIAAAPMEEAVELVRERGRRMEAAGSVDVRVSMLVDMEQGRALEHEALHGFLAREAERLGVAAPVTSAGYDLFAAIDAVRS